MVEFNWLICVAIFMGYCMLDWLYALYITAITDRKKLFAANVGVGLYILSAYGVMNYVADWRYVVPMCAGGWLGTYLSVWLLQLKDAKKEKNNGYF